MDEATTIIDFNAVDRAIIAALFISYGVLALFQLGNLFAGRFVLFALIALVTGAVAFDLPMAGADTLCMHYRSAITCNNAGQALASLLSVWIYVSAGALVLFGYVRGLRRLSGA